MARALAAYDARDPAGAAECFIDFWMGQGTWARMPDSRKRPIAATIGNLRQWAGALMNEPTPLSVFSSLRIPVLLMVGGDSPPPSRGVARLLVSALPQIELVELKGLGHMGPITHPEIVNDVITRFLERD